MCLEARGEHDWALSGLHLHIIRLIMYESERFVRHCCKVPVIFERCLFLRPGRNSQRELRSLSTNIFELANEVHGEHRASREAGDRAHWGRGGGKFHPDRIGGEVVARGAGGVRG